MPTFVAQVEFRFAAESVDACGKRLRELGTVAHSVGFEMKSGRVEAAPLNTDADAGGWTGYGPDER
jgi:hypothetical protein